MDALQLLRDDHLRVRDLFRRFDEEEDASTRKAIVDEAIVELTIHSQLEEEIFYPAMEREGMRELVAESEEEHQAAERIMDELAETSARETALEARFRTLVEMVIAHIDEEESEMFPRAAEVGYERLDRLGNEMQQLRDSLTSDQSDGARGTRSRARSRRAASGGRRAGSRSQGGSSRRASHGRTSRSGETKQELYERARKERIQGRSHMTKEELAEALRGR
jgi:hemerythrin-like domain-containing protein